MMLSTKQIIILWIITILISITAPAQTEFDYQQLTQIVQTYLDKYDDYYKTINSLFETLLKDPSLIEQYDFVKDEIMSVQFDIRELWPYIKFRSLIDKNHTREYEGMLYLDLTTIADSCRNRANGLEPWETEITDPTLNSILAQIIESCRKLALELSQLASQVKGN